MACKLTSARMAEEPVTSGAPRTFRGESDIALLVRDSVPKTSFLSPRLSSRRPNSLKLDTLPNGHVPAPPAPGARTLNVSFSELSYSVKTGIRRETKHILKRVNGDFQSGELTAIMGPSGAGKSTLMDILAGYTTDCVSGMVRVNGLERDVRQFRRHSSYIMQDDKLQPLLTVQEAMAIAANLKLGAEFCAKTKQERVDEILTSLGLSESRKTLTGSLSGGQRKRLAIALELVNNPPVMFFDEPTSGLDSSTSKQCVTVLKLLAREGRTVICTIHQPSATLLEMFDHLYVLSEGLCIYQGSIKGMVPYLSEVGLECPPYNNPADFVLEVAAGDYGDHNEALVTAIENGKCSDWRRRINDRNTYSTFGGTLPTGMKTPVHTPHIPPTPVSNPDGQHEDKHHWTQKRDHPTPLFTQFLILLNRTFLLLLRDKFLSVMRLVIHLVVGLLIGLLYFRIGNDAAYVFDNFGLLYFCIMFLMFTAFSSMMLTFPSEIPVISREYFNRWYSLKSYYLAITLADVPLQVVCVLCYTIVVYHMTSQPSSITRYILFVIMCALVCMVAQSIGLLIGVALNVQNGMVFGALAIMPFTIFSGFFVHMKDAPSYFQWLFHASYLKYGLDGVLIAVYSYKRESLECSEDYCHYSNPIKFLEALDMGHGSYWFNAFILTLMFLMLRLFCYFVLLYRVKHKY